MIVFKFMSGFRKRDHELLLQMSTWVNRLVRVAVQAVPLHKIRPCQVQLERFLGVS